MLVHNAIPALPIPQWFAADNFRSVFAKGAHDVIFILSSAFKSVIDVQVAIPLSVMPHVCCADRVIKDLANGAHVVILLLKSAFK